MRSIANAPPTDNHQTILEALTRIQHTCIHMMQLPSGVTRRTLTGFPCVICSYHQARVYNRPQKHPFKSHRKRKGARHGR
jgi:hypothetical protein